ncbi:MAG: hypothetical protein IKO02_06905 [Lentisphaeria bacterium]|nr:hypothetical protein [Lentisphaeria bacterium]
MIHDGIAGIEQSEKPLFRHGDRDPKERNAFVMPCFIRDKVVKIEESKTACNKDVGDTVAVNLFHIRFLLQIHS